MTRGQKAQHKRRCQWVQRHQPDGGGVYVPSGYAFNLVSRPVASSDGLMAAATVALLSRARKRGGK